VELMARNDASSASASVTTLKPRLNINSRRFASRFDLRNASELIGDWLTPCWSMLRGTCLESAKRKGQVDYGAGPERDVIGSSLGYV
jgi:hypothetical protein